MAFCPLSGAELYNSACAYMPGGNTRSNLHVDPFPLTLVSGEGAYVRRHLSQRI
jgi:glutamate-1-semialdehyde aminotransferase